MSSNQYSRSIDIAELDVFCSFSPRTHRDGRYVWTFDTRYLERVSNRKLIQRSSQTRHTIKCVLSIPTDAGPKDVFDCCIMIHRKGETDPLVRQYYLDCIPDAEKHMLFRINKAFAELRV